MVRFEVLFENNSHEDMRVIVETDVRKGYVCPILLDDIEDDIRIHLSVDAARKLVKVLPLAIEAVEEQLALLEGADV